MLRAGNRVHFESGNCFIEHVKTGKRTPIEERNGTFEVGVWVPKARQRANRVTATKRASVEEPSNLSFVRQDDRF